MRTGLHAVAAALALSVLSAASACQDPRGCIGGVRDYAATAPGWASPRMALDAFLADRPAHLPRTGWTPGRRAHAAVTYRSGDASVTIFRAPRGGWLVDSYRTC